MTAHRHRQPLELLSRVLLLACVVSCALAFGPSLACRRDGAAPLRASLKQRLHPPRPRDGKELPRLIVISGCPGTGKSTFGMSLALEQGILKCISTDTVRAVMRSYVPESISPPLHRSSYECSSDDRSDDPVKSWIETCKVLESSVEGLVDDAINRGVSLVLEGVSIRPSRKFIDKFTAAGGTACGVLLVVTDEDTQKKLLRKRGFITGNTSAEEKKLKSFPRVRAIQDEMIRSAKESDWVLIEQNVDPDPLDVVDEVLYKASVCRMKDVLIDELEEDCVLSGRSNVSKIAINDLFLAEKDHVQAAAEESEEQIEI